MHPNYLTFLHLKLIPPSGFPITISGLTSHPYPVYCRRGISCPALSVISQIGPIRVHLDPSPLPVTRLPQQAAEMAELRMLPQLQTLHFPKDKPNLCVTLAQPIRTLHLPPQHLLSTCAGDVSWKSPILHLFGSSISLYSLNTSSFFTHSFVLRITIYWLPPVCQQCDVPGD